MPAVKTVPVFRAARPDDLEMLLRFAREAGPGITSLPDNPKILEEKLRPSDGSYLFCIEIDGQTAGTAGITSRIGKDIPFFAYHLLHERLYSTQLKVDRETPVLHFIQARKKPTEIGTLYLDKAHRGKGLGKLLSLGRFLFIASFLERFADTLIAEVRGFNHAGVSPFYEAVGRHFFDLPFPEADRLRTSHPECIEELFPKLPIYTSLLPKEAQDAMFRPHPNTLPAMKLLESQGFKQSDYCDIFDAGPHLWIETSQARTVRESVESQIIEIHPDCDRGKEALIAKIEHDFRVTQAPIFIRDGGVVIAKPVADTLQVTKGETVRYYWV